MSSTTVTFWKDKDFSGKSKKYDGAQKVSDLNEVQWSSDSNRDDMKDDIGSIQTGPQAWVRVYSKANYAGRTTLIGPSSKVNMEDVKDDGGSDDMDDTIESFEIYDHKPEVDTSKVVDNFLALYPGSTQGRLHNLYNIEFYAQDTHYRIYYPTITYNSDGTISFQIKLDHVQAESDDHATVTFAMDLKGNFSQSIQVTYEMADASQIPDWAIKLIDGAIDVAADAAKIIADGAEIVVTDGVGVVATVETDKLIDYTAKAITFCVDHLNTVLSAVFLYQDNGGTSYFPALVSQAIARLVLAYYQELYGADGNAKMTFDEATFRANLGNASWNESKHNPYVDFTQSSYPYRSFFPDNTFFYAHGGALSSVKIDAVTDNEKDDHLTLQAAFGAKGQLFSVVGSIDIFSRSNPKGYVAPASGLLMYNDQGQMVQIRQDKTIVPIQYASLQDAFAALLKQALSDSASQYGTTITDQQRSLVDAAVTVLNAIDKAI